MRNQFVRLLLISGLAQTLFLSGCGFGDSKKTLVSIMPSVGTSNISGLVEVPAVTSLVKTSSIFSLDYNASNSLLTCDTTGYWAYLYELDSTTGLKKEPALAKSIVKSNGYYQINYTTKLKSTSINYIVEVKDCSNPSLQAYSRPITAYQNQNVDFNTSLVAASFENDTTASMFKNFQTDKMGSLIEKVASVGGKANSIGGLYANIKNDSSKKNVIESFVGSGFTFTSLEKSRPQILVNTLNAVTINEQESKIFKVNAVHWNPNYNTIVKWKLNGQWAFNGNQFNYVPDKNSQGTQVLQVFVGADDGSGQIDLTKALYSRMANITVNNTFPVTAPAVSFLSSATSSPSVNLQINTGAGLFNCATFTDFAITFTNSMPASNLFNKSCATNGTQTESISLPVGDGIKTVYVWARDSAGNISTAQSASITLDNTNPTVSISALPSKIKGGAAQAISWTSSDALSGIASLELSYSTGGAFTVLATTADSSLSTSSTSWNWTAPAIDSTSVRLRLTATDQAGNSALDTTSLFEIDSAAPSAASITLTSSSITNSANITMTVASCTDRPQVAVTTTNSAPADNSSLWVTCSAAPSALTTTISPFVNNTNYTLYIWARDSVKNNSAAATVSVTADTVAPTFSFVTPVASTKTRGSGTLNLQWTGSDNNPSTNDVNIEYSIDGGLSWSSLISGRAFTGSYNWTVPSSINVSNARIRLTSTDLAGNSNSISSSDFIIDSTAPVISSFVTSSGQTILATNQASVRVNATDDRSGIGQIRIAETSTSNCQTSYADNNWQAFTNGGGAQDYLFVSSASVGAKKLCVWAKDQSGNVSSITTNSSGGTVGVDTLNFTLDLGSPPQVTSLSITNGNGASPDFGTNKFGAGDQINISFTVTDNQSLATQPVRIERTTDGSTFTTVATNANVGNRGGSATSWSSTYNSLTAPNPQGFFRLRLIVTDSTGNTASLLSDAFNTGGWEVFAGNDDDGNGASAISARLTNSTGAQNRKHAAMTSDGSLFIADTSQNCIRKVDNLTGVINNYLCYGTETGVPGAVNSSTRISGTASWTSLFADGDNLYIYSRKSVSGNNLGIIYKVKISTNNVSIYAGGGTTIGATTSAVNAYLSPDSLAFTIDPSSKSMYMFVPCVFNQTGSGTNVNYQIAKINQDGSGAATNLEIIAGTCSRPGTVSPFVNGDDAVTTPFLGSTTYYLTCCMNLSYATSNQSLYVSVNGVGTFKIQSGKYYMLSGFTTSTLYGMYYSPTLDRLYVNPSAGISYFTPLATTTGNESVITVIPAMSGTSAYRCNDDGVASSSGCVAAATTFPISDTTFGFIDGNNGNTMGNFRVRYVDSDNKIRTLAGTPSFSGAGGDRKLARFGRISGIQYKNTAVNAAPVSLPAGLYLGDSVGMTFSRVDNGTNNLEWVAGNGIAQTITNGGTFGLNALSTSNASQYYLGNFVFDENGRFVWQSGILLHRQSSSNTITQYTNGGVQIERANDATNATSLQFMDTGGYTGMLVDSDGRIYYGGHRYLYADYYSYPRLGVINTDGKYYRVIGADSLSANTSSAVGDAVSTDGAVKTAGVFKTIKCNMSSSNNCYMQIEERFNSGDKRLLFIEQNKIRSISRPYDSGTSQLSTLTDLTRSAGAFVYRYVNPGNATDSTIDRIYYISGGGLYCKIIDGAASANCNNTRIGPPSGMKTLSSEILTQDSSGNLYLVNSNNNQVYKFNPPN